MRRRSPTDEHRRRIRHWVRFRDLEHQIHTSDGITERCAICRSAVDAGQTAFIITFKGIMIITLDRACMDLWCSEIVSAIEQTVKDAS
jgi:hypothetical protein